MTLVMASDKVHSKPTPATTGQHQGTVVKVGLYDVERTIGKGNFAVVKFARHRITKTEVAIKIVDKSRLDAANLEKVKREVRVLKMLNHPNIIKIYQVMETKNMIYMVTEYAAKGEIFDYIATKGRMSEADARVKFWQIISAVDYCHSLNVVHRDLKAENLLLDGNGNIKLADFGFSNFFKTGHLLNTFCGSPPYAAPEVFEGKKYFGPEVDIWSLGVILYVLTCGALPFDGESLQLLKDRVLSGRFRIPFFLSTDCEHLLRRMLIVDPQKRFTLAKIKTHRWMNQGEPSGALQRGGSTTSLDSTSSGELADKVLKLMEELGIDALKTKESIKNESYDNFSAIYMFLYDRYLSKESIHSGQSRRRGIEQDHKQHSRPNKPMLGAIRNESSSFSQTTDCCLPVTPPTFATSVASSGSTTSSCGADSGVETMSSFSESLSRQSTIASSIDEGVAIGDSSMSPMQHSLVDAQYLTGVPLSPSLFAQCGGPGPLMDFRIRSEPDSGTATPQPSASPVLSHISNHTASAGQTGELILPLSSPFESFDSQIERDVMSSLSSYSAMGTDGSTVSTKSLPPFIAASTAPSCSNSPRPAAPPPLAPRSNAVNSVQDTGIFVNTTTMFQYGTETLNGVVAQTTDFRQGRHASDHVIFDNFSETDLSAIVMSGGLEGNSFGCYNQLDGLFPNSSNTNNAQQPPIIPLAHVSKVGGYTELFRPPIPVSLPPSPTTTPTHSLAVHYSGGPGGGMVNLMPPTSFNPPIPQQGSANNSNCAPVPGSIYPRLFSFSAMCPFIRPIGQLCVPVLPPTPSQMSGNKRAGNLRQRPPLPKRSSMTEREMQPHRMLALKQSRFVAQILEHQTSTETPTTSAAEQHLINDPDASTLTPPAELDSLGTMCFQTNVRYPSSMAQSRVNQKRQLFQHQARRRGILRQQSYQQAQKQPVGPNSVDATDADLLERLGQLTTLSAGPFLPTPLSPIEDTASQQEMEAERDHEKMDES